MAQAQKNPTWGLVHLYSKQETPTSSSVKRYKFHFVNEN